MNTTSKRALFKATENELTSRGFNIIDQDMERPWGGFFVINESQAKQFIASYFEEMEMDEINISGKLSPKILLVEPKKRLSWQYHHRRAELWKVIQGPVGVVRSTTDEQGPVQQHNSGELIKLKQGERHRLIGLENWGKIAEIWQHVDASNPSNEEDIIRLEDDFGR